LDLQDWEEGARSFSGIAGYVTYDQSLTTHGPARSVSVSFVTPSFFSVLGIRPQLGRFFVPAENRPGGPVQKAVIADGLWRSLWAGNPDVLGRTVHVRGADFEVIGIAPPGFGAPGHTVIWVPLQARYAGFEGELEWWKARDARYHEAIARLRPGVSLEQAQSEMQVLGDRLAREVPATNRETEIRVRSLREKETGSLRPYLLMLTAAVALLLVVACVNIGNILLARAVAREAEMAVRAALGAGRVQVLRLLAVEAAMLSA